MAHVHRLTPSPALIFTTIISLVVLIPGDFQSIVNYFRWRLTLFLLHFYFVWGWGFLSTHCFFCFFNFSSSAVFSFSAWFFYAIVLSGLIYLKIKKKDLPRSYKVSVIIVFTLHDNNILSSRLVIPLPTGSHCNSYTGPHCSDIPRAGTHHRQSSDWVPLRGFIYLKWHCSLHTLHPLQALPKSAGQVNSVLAALLRGRPCRQKPVISTEHTWIASLITCR